MNIKPKLVEDKASISRRWSVKIMKFGTAATAAWLALIAAGLTDSVPAWAAQAVAGVIFVAALVASYLAQPEPKDAP